MIPVQRLYADSILFLILCDSDFFLHSIFAFLNQLEKNDELKSFVTVLLNLLTRRVRGHMPRI